jgi:hypothetical protein
VSHPCKWNLRKNHRIESGKLIWVPFLKKKKGFYSVIRQRELVIIGIFWLIRNQLTAKDPRTIVIFPFFQCKLGNWRRALPLLAFQTLPIVFLSMLNSENLKKASKRVRVENQGNEHRTWWTEGAVGQTFWCKILRMTTGCQKCRSLPRVAPGSATTSFCRALVTPGRPIQKWAKSKAFRSRVAPKIWIPETFSEKKT